MKNTNKIELAMEVMRNAHKGQKRDDGTDYILHPMYVADKFEDETLKVSALLHDVVEDSNTTLEDLKQYGFSDEVIDIVDRLTKREDESYMDYLKRVIGNHKSWMIKIEDIKHNLSNHRPSNRKDKYELALEYLRR